MSETAIEMKRAYGGMDVPAPGTWVADPDHSKTEFVARHLMVTKVRGRFDEVDARIYVGEAPEDSKVEVRIGTASITTGATDRDEHLRSPDFLDVERYPEMIFRSTGVERAGERGLRIEGDLTIRDVTEPVTLDAEFQGMFEDPWGNSRFGFSATTRIDREQWGMTWNHALTNGGWLVSKEVDIEIEISALHASAVERAA